MLLARSEDNMYLSKVEIDRKNRRKTKDLHHVGAIHNWVERSFPKETEKENRSRKLWRLDRLQGKEYLLLVSKIKPDLTVLEKYGVKDSAATKEYTPFLRALQNGTKARFRVTLNPVIAVKDGTSKRGRVKPHVTVKQQMQFLLDRAEVNGFQLKEDEFTIVDRGYVEFKRSGQRSISLSKATYEGILTITDRDKFIETLTRGFGKKKAYGFGMMTVIPINDEK